MQDENHKQDSENITPTPTQTADTYPNTTAPSLEPALSYESSPSQTPGPSIIPTQNQPADVRPPAKQKERGIFSFLATLIAAFILVQVINMFVFQSYKVFGSSMVPTLHDGDRLIISKIGKTTSKLRGKHFEPSRGDIIVFIDPLQPELQLIKRVIGLPGERVVVDNGKIKVYNNENPKGFNPDASGIYHADLPETSGKKDVTVPKNELFVSGDNREGSNSLDSRNELGTVPLDYVIGTLELRLWPIGDAQFF